MSVKFWRLGIVGWPLGYSLSPAMHHAALKAAGLRGEYKEYPVKPEDLDRWLKEVAPTLDGFNVTMPHKEAVYQGVRRRGEIPRQGIDDAIGALNTVKVRNGRLSGYNTDGGGFLAPLSKRAIVLRGKTAFLLGAGGAAQAIAVYLAVWGKISRLTILDKEPLRAESLVSKVKALGAPCGERISAAGDLSSAVQTRPDLIVNATPLGMAGHGPVPRELRDGITGDQIVYDIVYEPRETGLIRAARKAGCTVITGDEMLAAQGAEAFRIWTGKAHALDGRPILDVMHEALDKVR